MTRVGCFLRRFPQFRRVLADFEPAVSWAFPDSKSAGKLGLASGPTSHGSFAERQNRYPSPMQGLVRVLIKLLHFFVENRTFGGIAKSAVKAEAWGGIVNERKFRGWLVNSNFWQSHLCSRSLHVGILCLNRPCWVPVPVQRALPLSAATPRPVRSQAWASICSARTSATAAKSGLTSLQLNRATGALSVPVAFAFAYAPGWLGREQMGTV